MMLTRDERGTVSADRFDTHLVVSEQLLANADPKFLRHSPSDGGHLTIVCENGIATYSGCGCSSNSDERCFRIVVLSPGLVVPTAPLWSPGA